MRHFSKIIFGAALCALTAGAGAAQELGTALTRARALVDAGLPVGEAEAFGTVLSELGPDGAPILGHLLYTQRHFDKAAWFFGAGAGADNATSLTNFGAVLNDLNASAPDTYPVEALDMSVALLEGAVALNPELAGAWNDLGRAALRLARARGGDGALEGRAAEAGAMATGLDGENPLFWANLAEALAAIGDADGAAAALARAHQINPVHPAYLGAQLRMAEAGASGEADRSYCEVNYRCQEICPKSIIGGLMSVTCEMAGSSAQMACQAGEPYAPNYNCKEDFPEYGILIPGLNAGFSISVPGFSAHVLVDGDGTVRTRVEGGVSVGPVGGYLRADGAYSPNGEVSVTNMGGGVRVSVMNKNPAGEMATKFGHAPVQIEAETVGGNPVVVGVEAYNAAVITN